MTLGDLLVIDRTRTGGPTGVHHAFYAQRPASVEDLIEVLREYGAKELAAVPHGQPTHALFVQAPGSYLVIPLDTLVSRKEGA